LKVNAFPLDFYQQGPAFFPVDRELFQLAAAFCEKYLVNHPRLCDYKRVWVAARTDAAGKPTDVRGIMAVDLRVDIPLIRFLDAKAAKKLIERVNANLADQGLRGREVFIYKAEKEAVGEECPHWQEWLKILGAEPAERWKAQVK